MGEAADLRRSCVFEEDLRFAAGFRVVFVCAVSSEVVSCSVDGWGVISTSAGVRTSVFGSTVGFEVVWLSGSAVWV